LIQWRVRRVAADTKIGIQLTRILRILIEAYSYLFHIILALFLLALGLVGMMSQTSTFRIDMLPWESARLVSVLVWGNLIGICCILLALFGKFRWLYPIWAAAVLYYLANGVFNLKHYRDPEEFKAALWFVFGGAGAFLGSLLQLRRSFARGRR